MINKSLAKYILTIIISFFILGIILFFVKVPYKISTIGIIYPAKEWQLFKNSNGQLINITKNYIDNSVSSFSVTEFQRGDAFSFKLNPGIFLNADILKGDTIAFLFSNAYESRLIELESEREVQKQLLEVYDSGEKKEDILWARENIALKEAELETAQKLYKRIEKLFNENLIAEKEHDLSYLDLKIKEQNLSIAKAHLQTMSTGMKPQQIEYAQSRIKQLDNQIEQTKKLIETQVITAPFDGQIIKQNGIRDTNNAENIIVIGDTKNLIAVLPLNYYEVPYLSLNDSINLYYNSRKGHVKGKIIDIGNMVYFANKRQLVNVTVSLTPIDNVFFNIITEAQIDCGLISIKDYLKRLSQVIYEN